MTFTEIFFLFFLCQESIRREPITTLKDVSVEISFLSSTAISNSQSPSTALNCSYLKGFTFSNSLPQNTIFSPEINRVGIPLPTYHPRNNCHCHTTDLKHDAEHTRWQSNFIVRGISFQPLRLSVFIAFKVLRSSSVKASHEWANKDILLGRSYRYRVGKTISAIGDPETAIITSQSATVRQTQRYSRALQISNYNKMR